MKSKKAILATLIVSGVMALFASGQGLYAAAPDGSRPWMNTSLSPMERARLLVHAMTLDEKIEQIHMTDVRERPREIPGIERLGIPTFKITNGPAAQAPATVGLQFQQRLCLLH